MQTPWKLGSKGRQEHDPEKKLISSCVSLMKRLPLLWIKIFSQKMPQNSSYSPYSSNSNQSQYMHASIINNISVMNQMIYWMLRKINNKKTVVIVASKIKCELQLQNLLQLNQFSSAAMEKHLHQYSPWSLSDLSISSSSSSFPHPVRPPRSSSSL